MIHGVSHPMGIAADGWGQAFKVAPLGNIRYNGHLNSGPLQPSVIVPELHASHETANLTGDRFPGKGSECVVVPVPCGRFE